MVQIYNQTDFDGVPNRLNWEPCPDERILLIGTTLNE